MRRIHPLAISLLGVISVTCPRTLLADRLEEQYKHASELLWAGDLQEAQSEFEAILHKKKNYKSAKVLLGLTLARLSNQSEKQGDRIEAISQLRQALSLDPQEAYWHSALAKLLHAQGNADEAANECAQAARLSPEDSDLARGCGFGLSPLLVNDKTVTSVSGPPKNGSPTPPRPVYNPNPAYSEKARLARLHGVIVLSLVVSAEGEVTQAAISQPLGLGLDESALNTVRTWKFEPATRNGAPIPDRVMVEVSFRLF